MKSGLRRMARPRNFGTPVPMSGSGFFKQSSLALGGNETETLLRCYGVMGTVYSCVSLYAEGTAAPEWHLYRKEKQPAQAHRYTKRDEGSDQRTEVFTHAALSLLNSPNDFYSRFSLFEASQQYMDLAGENYWVIGRAPGYSIPISIWPVRPDRMTEVPDSETYLKGWVYTSPDGQQKVPLLPHEVIQVKYPNPLDSYHGLGPVQSVLVDIEAAKYSAEWNRNFFLNSAEPGGVIQVDHAMDDDEWEEFMSRWREQHRGVSRAHRVAVLEGGATWVPNQHSMKDMDFASLRNLSRDVIREAFRMHKVMLGVSDDVNRANAQTGEEVFSSWGVVPRLDRWKDALNHWLLPMFGPAGADVEFDYVRPIPANREQDNMELTAKSAAAAVLISAGLEPDDVLEAVGLPAMRTAPKPPPSGLPPGAPPPAALPAPGAGESAAESAGGGDMEARVRKMLSNGHLPVLAGRQ